MSEAGSTDLGARLARLRAVASRLVIDQLTADVLQAFRAEGIPCIVMKGPAIVHWLYGELDGRSYADSDLLVPPERLTDVDTLLAGLGFRRWFGDDDMADRRPLHGHQWTRAGEPGSVDIHRTFPGIGAPPPAVWEAFAERTTTLTIAGVQAAVTDRVSTALLVALHAAWHGRVGVQPLRDLALAVTRFDDGVWADAALLAERLQATAAFAAGLRLEGRGEALAARLGLPTQLPFETVLTARHPRRGAVGLYRLATTEGVKGKTLLIWRKLVPSPALLRSISPLARRGRLGFAAAYASRPFLVLWRTGFALRALWLARKETR